MLKHISVVSLGLCALLFATQASAASGYQLRGEIQVNGETVGRPIANASPDTEAYVIIQSEQHQDLRLTFTISEESNNTVQARFVIEQDRDEGWEPMMQPSVQAVLDQEASVTLSPDNDEDDEYSFVFTISETDVPGN